MSVLDSVWCLDWNRFNAVIHYYGRNKPKTQSPKLSWDLHDKVRQILYLSVCGISQPILSLVTLTILGGVNYEATVYIYITLAFNFLFI
jgi:hypothetical protein